MSEPERRPCPQCGELIAVGAKLCRFCQAEFNERGEVAKSGAAGAPHAEEGDATGGIIPYKNTPALIAYYCGVFSVIPCFLIGIAAFVLGLKGLKVAKERPAVRGKVHAWIGILVGGFFGLLWTILTVLVTVAPLMARR